MKKYDVSIRAFVKGNLGDDIFIHILTNRYPNASFAICGEKEYQYLFKELQNLDYVCTDEWWRKYMFRVRNLPVYLGNRIRRFFHKPTKWPYYRCAEYLNDRSRYQVLISGSIFMQLEPKFIKNYYHAEEQRFYQKKPMIMGCNFGPYLNEEYREFYEECFSMARQVCFRDSYSYSLFKGDNIYWAPDILFLYPKENYIEPKQKEYVFISVVNLLKDDENGIALEEKYENAVVDFIQELQASGENLVLAGFCKTQKDNEVIERILSKLQSNNGISVVNYPDVSYQEMVGYVAAAKSIVATRYHAMILGWVFGKKVLPISYGEKMLHVIEDMAMEFPYLQVEDITGERLKEAYYRSQKQGIIEVEECIDRAAMHFLELDRVLKL